MKGIKIASWSALVATTLPCLMFFFGLITLDVVKILSLIGTIAWFVTTPLWIGREPRIDAKEVEI